jgi:hypothetical protein
MRIPQLTQSARKYSLAFALILLLAAAGFAAPVLWSPDKTYRNDAYHFSVRIPKTYAVSEMSGNSGTYDYIAFSGATSSIQSFLSPWPDEKSVLTEDAAAAEYPENADLPDSAPFNVAPGVVGLALNGPNFTEIWFAYKETLYQFKLIDGSSSDFLRIMRTIKLY